jgi:hypothetical protein
MLTTNPNFAQIFFLKRMLTINYLHKKKVPEATDKTQRQNGGIFHRTKANFGERIDMEKNLGNHQIMTL